MREILNEVLGVSDDAVTEGLWVTVFGKVKIFMTIKIPSKIAINQSKIDNITIGGVCVR